MGLKDGVVFTVRLGTEGQEWPHDVPALAHVEDTGLWHHALMREDEPSVVLGELYAPSLLEKLHLPRVRGAGFIPKVTLPADGHLMTPLACPPPQMAMPPV